MRRRPTLALRGVELFVPAAREVVETSNSFGGPLVMSYQAFDETFGGRATGWDEVLGCTTDWRRREGTRAA